MPFIIFFNGQIFFLAAVFTLSVNNGEKFLADEDGDYTGRTVFGRSYLKVVDFVENKDEFKFSSFSGDGVYLLAILYLNIIILNLVIALVGDVYENVMALRKEIELMLKAELLKELYEFKSAFKFLPFFK